MAWLDDRAWSHPKVAALTDRAFRVWVHGIAYSAGYSTRGVLTVGAQRIIGSSAAVRRQLLEAGLWETTDDGVSIHDWDAHNGKRDDRRVAERERMRARRAQERTANGSPTNRRTVAQPSRVEGSEGSEGSDGSDRKPRAVVLPGSDTAQVKSLIDASLKGAA